MERKEQLVHWASQMAQIVKNPLAKMRVRSLGWEDPLEKGMSNSPWYSCLENSMHRAVWQATLHGVARVRHTRLSNGTTIDMLTTWTSLQRMQLSIFL